VCAIPTAVSKWEIRAGIAQATAGPFTWRPGVIHGLAVGPGYELRGETRANRSLRLGYGFGRVAANEIQRRVVGLAGLFSVLGQSSVTEAAM
jgi:hypothetical protein